MTRDRYQQQARDAEKQKKEKQKEKSKEKLTERELSRSHSQSRAKGAESGKTEPASGGAAEKKVAKPKLAVPASVSGGSTASTSKGLGSGRAEPKWKSSWDTMEYLTALHSELYSSPKARELKARITALYKGFHAREKIRNGSYQQGREPARNQTGYSRK